MVVYPLPNVQQFMALPNKNLQRNGLRKERTFAKTFNRKFYVGDGVGYGFR